MKKTVALCLALICILYLVSCTSSDKTNFSKMEDLEKWISDERASIEDFKILHIKVDTIDSPKHEKSLLMIDASYLYNGESISKGFAFEITYNEFLTLYDNNGYIVYNVQEEDDIVTDINTKSLDILKKAFEANWNKLDK